MAPILSHQMACGDPYNTYLVIIKVHGSAIKLFGTNSVSQKDSYRILCHDMDNRADGKGSGVQVFVLDEAATTTDKSLFQGQKPTGQEVSPNHLALFMTSPIDSSKKASYALDIGVIRHMQSLGDPNDDGCKKIGSAFIYLEPKFSTQGIQRMQIMAAHNRAPIGQIQVEYLIVTNPHGYGVKAPRPQWLSKVAQLDAGHRGAGSGCRADLNGYPVTENTVASFNYAAQHGADMCELDVMCTADGVPVVYHNYTLNDQNTTQIDELTLDELRRMRHHSIHDANCKHPRDSSAIAQLDEKFQAFPTLEEVLRDVNKSCGLNIEFKWAQILPSGKTEATHYREINDFVDRILECIFKHCNDRAILLSTLNADIAIMLRLKQTKYPVLFLTTGDSQRFHDPATKTVKNAIHFAQAFDMAGINPNAAYLDEYLVQYAQDRGLLVYAWGKIESPQMIQKLRRYGLNGVIYDKIDLIKPQD